MPDSIAWEDSLGDIASPGDVVAGKYRIERVLGQGGMGVVVEAFHLQFEERVAMKFLLPQMGANAEAVARFEREARAAFKIKSEHVARVIDVGKLDGGAPFLVMEFLEGVDLAEVLAKDRQLPVATAVEYILQVCEAVAEAHAIDIVHRDLKPENLFLTRRSDGSPCIKVLDFGLSKVTKSDARDRMLTASAQAMGTPQYMSPEQWLSARDVGPGSDIWALGIILYELVTGVQPFNKEQLPQLCTMVLSGQPDPMTKWRPETPAELEKIILKCLRKDANERFSNVGELAVKLQPFSASGDRSATKRITGTLRKAGIEVDEDAPPSARTQASSFPNLASTQVMSDPDSFDDINETRQKLIQAEAAMLAARQVPRQVQVTPTQNMQQPAAQPQWLGYPNVGYPSAPPPRKADTGQSWQHMLEGDAPRRRTSRVWLVVSIVAVVGIVGSVALIRWKSPARPEGAAAEATEPKDAPKDAPATLPQASSASSARAPASAAPSASEIRPSDSSAPVVGSKRPGKTRPHRDIFHDR